MRGNYEIVSGGVIKIICLCFIYHKQYICLISALCLPYQFTALREIIYHTTILTLTNYYNTVRNKKLLILKCFYQQQTAVEVKINFNSLDF